MSQRPSQAVPWETRVLFAIVGVLSLALVAAAIAVLNRPAATPLPPPALRPVRVAGAVEMLGDPDVRSVLEVNHHMDVRQTERGTRALADEDLGSFDAVIVASQALVSKAKAKLNGLGTEFPMLSSRMAILTFQPIIELLARPEIGMAWRSGDDWVIDLARYVRLVETGWRWIDIPGNVTYPRDTPILMTVSNPVSSNSAGMFIGLASCGLNNNRVVSDAATADRLAKLIRPAFDGLGQQTDRTTDVLDTYISGGRDSAPLALVYQNDLLATWFNHRDQLPKDMVVAAPATNVQTYNVLIAKNEDGAALGKALTEDPELVRVSEQKYGYRTGSVESFNRTLAAVGAPIVIETNNCPTPRAEILDRMIAVVTRQ